MKSTKFIVIAAVFAIVAAVFFFALRNQRGGAGTASRENPQEEKSAGYEPQTDEQGEVAVKVVPVELSENAQVWKFEVAQSTHSVELDVDMVKNSVLFDNSGREYRPLSWEGAPAGGHHRQGVLNFAPISPMPKSVEIQIKGVGSVASRSFKWQLIIE